MFREQYENDPEQIQTEIDRMGRENITVQFSANTMTRYVPAYNEDATVRHYHFTRQGHFAFMERDYKERVQGKESLCDVPLLSIKNGETLCDVSIKQIPNRSP